MMASHFTDVTKSYFCTIFQPIMIENTTILTRAELGTLFGEEHCHDVPAECTSISTDTRYLKPGALFIALSGERFDGHDHVRTAMDKGAYAVMVLHEKAQHFADLPHIAVDDTLFALGELAGFHRRKFSLPVIAIAGAAGKTSTKELIAHCCSAQGHTLKTEANYNNRIGVPLTLLQLQKDHKAAVIEIGTNEPGEIERLAQIVAPTVGVITNIGKEHLEKLIDLDGVEKEETALFRFLENTQGIPVVNLDDERLQKYACLDQAITFSTQRNADVATSYEYDSRLHPHLTVSYKHDTSRTTLQTIGLTAVLNATAACAACIAAGMKIQTVAEALASYVPKESHGYARMVVTSLDGIMILNDCYNANPESMTLALQTLHEYPAQGKKIAVLGDMRELGEAAKHEHMDILTLAIHHAHHIIVLGDFFMEAARMMTQANTIMTAHTHEQCAKYIVDLCHTGDTLLIKGSRGMAMENVLISLHTLYEMNKE